MEKGYGMLRGRQGAAGYVRAAGENRRVFARGLPPGAEAALWRIEGEKACRCAGGKADREGNWAGETHGAGPLFVTAAGRVIMWEEGTSAEESYFRCCGALKKAAEKPQKKGTPPAPPENPVPEEKRPVEGPPAPRETSAAPERPAVPEPARRASADTPPVDALPVLSWPRGTEELRPFFELLPPFSPFYAPGWRFVRAPSPLPGTAYCALGRYVRDGRVRRIAYALPGTPYRPPAELPGYRYHLGYWVLEKEAT
ncbi:MAG: hypothetical protein J5472_03980 [Clostridia bacterium]|nr:hypothetical protein [Clostridia bacterium]